MKQVANKVMKPIHEDRLLYWLPNLSYLNSLSDGSPT